jgi:choline dehydrogenase-like flavoprotein
MPDVIVVGAGAAGCVVASRLAEAGKAVLLLEAGPDRRSGLPASLSDGWRIDREALDWGLMSEPDGVHDARHVWRKKLVGGTGWLTRFTPRGHPGDYAAWGDGWTWPEVLPYFCRLETDEDFGKEPWHGDSGPLACGMVGMSTSALQSIITAGRRVHVWVTDASPSGEGTRVMALELTQLDIPHTVIPDSAVGWLFANRAVDAAALRGDTLASNGDSVALLGAKAVAQLAADRGVPVHVLAPEVSWDRAARDTSHLVLDMRSAAELGSAQRARLNPVFDIVPARLVSAYVSERVVVSPPFKEPR